LHASALARRIDPTKSSRGLLLVSTTDLRVIIGTWRFSYCWDAGLSGSMLLADATGEGAPYVSQHLRLVGTHFEDTIIWDFECPACLFRRLDRHPVLFLCLGDEPGSFVCAKDLRTPVALVPGRWLTFVEPVAHGW
jgi:hypothetical protein